MSNCSEHKKDLFGQTDMKLVAEAIGDLHYESLFELLDHLRIKLAIDSKNDGKEGREKLADGLWHCSMYVAGAAGIMKEICRISKPFMESNKTIKT